MVFDSDLYDCKEIGMWKIMTKQSNRLFSGVFEAYELHSKAVRLSDDFDILAKSTRCVQAIKHATKEIYGVMFHPEVRNPDIIRRFLEL